MSGPKGAPRKPIKRIVCIQLGGEYPDFCFRLVMPDYGLPLIGTILSEAGYDVTVFVEHVKPPDWSVVAQADLVCLSSLSAGADKNYQMADRIRRELKVPVIIGGTHATYFTRDTLLHCDYVVLGEGDEIILDLVSALSEGRSPSTVPGIAYMEGEAVRKTRARLGPQRFDTVPNFELIAGYPTMSKWDVLRNLRMPLMTVQSSRGCHFHCTYCIVDTMFTAGYRKRDIESVIRDLKDKRKYGRELLFVDNEFSSVPARTRALLKRMIEEKLDYDIMVLARTELAKQDETLELMAKAGVTQVYQGYESINPDTLDGYDKHQTVERIQKSIEKLHSYGFRISGSFVIGADTDTLQTVEASAQFVVDNKLTIAYFFPLWGHYIEEKMGGASIVPRHRAIFKRWANTDGNFVSHFPKNMRPSQLQRALNAAHKKVFSAKEVVKALARGKKTHAWEKATHVWMWSTIQKGVNEYIPWLEEIERGLYDEKDQLKEDVLLERWKQRPPWRFPDTADLGPAILEDAKPITLQDASCTTPGPAKHVVPGAPAPVEKVVS